MLWLSPRMTLADTSVPYPPLCLSLSLHGWPAGRPESMLALRHGKARCGKRGDSRGWRMLGARDWASYRTSLRAERSNQERFILPWIGSLRSLESSVGTAFDSNSRSRCSRYPETEKIDITIANELIKRTKTT